VHIPEKYYERIPQFYFVVGVLLLANAMYLGLEDFAAYFYLAFGIVSLLYAVGVKRARENNRNYPETTTSQQTQSEAETETEIKSDVEPGSEARELS
jgi:hypothetical protein